MNYWTQSKDNIYVAGHRGWCGKYPENTMESFRAALELGVDQIETDVRTTKDGVLVLIHDHTVDRTTNGTGRVLDYTYEELCALDAGSWKDPAFTGCRIPTLREFMELVKDHPTMTIDIELKEYPTDVGEEIAFRVCDETIAMVEEYGYGDRCVINSFSNPLNEYVARKYPGKYRQHVYFPDRNLSGDATVSPYSYAYCACVFGIGDYVTVDQIRKFSEETGVRVWAPASLSNEAGVDLSLAMGAEMICSNHPDELLAILRRRGLHK